MRKIAFYSQKGGVGKTSLSFNIGYELSRLGKKTLLVDADPQANLSGILASSPNYTLANVLLREDNPIGLESVPAQSAIYPTAFPNLFILPANRDLAPAAHIATNAIGGDRRLRQVLSSVTGFDCVLLDSAPTNSLLTLSVLVACDSVYVPLGPGIWDVEAIGKTQATVAEIQQSMEIGVSVAGIVLNRWTKNKVAKNVAAEMESLFAGKVLGTIPEGVKLSEANFRKLPIGVYAPESPIADSFKTIARNLLSWQIQKVA